MMTFRVAPHTFKYSTCLLVDSVRANVSPSGGQSIHHSSSTRGEFERGALSQSRDTLDATLAAELADGSLGDAPESTQ